MLNSIVSVLDSGGAAAGGAGAFESIATSTVGAGGTASITFSSIPNTYKHLQIRGIGRNTNSGLTGINTTFNSDSGNNYTRHWILTFDGGGPYASASAGVAYTSIGYTSGDNANVFSGIVLDIHNYASTTQNKTLRYFVGNEINTAGNSTIAFGSGLWMSTSAITSITLNAANWAEYSTLALYGIKGE